MMLIFKLMILNFWKFSNIIETFDIRWNKAIIFSKFFVCLFLVSIETWYVPEWSEDTGTWSTIF